jgi:hypothetical protein
MSSSSSGPVSAYRLDELGWLQFDRLCALLIEAEAGVRDLDWNGASDTWCMTTVQEPIVVGSRGSRMDGPVTIAAFWIPDDAPPGARLSELAVRMASMLDASGDSGSAQVLVLTNLETVRVDTVFRAQAFVRQRRLVVMGAGEIGASLDRHPGLRSALPSVLGLRDLRPLIDADVLGRSSLDLERAQELARVFWPTRAYDRARLVLEAHRFVVLTGPPEMGKTAIAQMLALAKMTDGWEVHECTDPDQVWRLFDRERRQVFVADDAFGSTEYRPDSAERWALALGRLLGALDANHWLIWTSRPAPLKAGLRRVQREQGAERFPTPGEVLVDASDLDLQEKTLILYRHAKAHGMSGAGRTLLRSAGVSIVEHPHFTPERIRRFITDRVSELPDLAAHGPELDVLLLVVHELASPTDAMRTSFNALATEHRDLLVALLDAPAGLIDERELAATVRRHRSGGLSLPPGELIDRLTDHFVRVTPFGIGWVHPSWRDLVIEQLRADESARQRFLAQCGVDGVTLALSQEGGGSGERNLPLLETDADWDHLGDRMPDLIRELEPRDLSRVLLTLDTALDSIEDRTQLREAQNLAVHLLNATRRMWNQTGETLPAFLLGGWFRVSKHLTDDIERPTISPTWVELHPGFLLMEQPDRDELLRTDEWLAFAQMLLEYDVGVLMELGFFARDRDLLESLVTSLPQVAASQPDLRPLSESVLKRIEELVPALAERARSAFTSAGYAEELETSRWWVPHDIAAPPSTESVTAKTDFTRDDVDRVLSDL